jgi:hypothetical protein
MFMNLWGDVIWQDEIHYIVYKKNNTGVNSKNLIAWCAYKLLKSFQKNFVTQMSFLNRCIKIL